MFGGTRWNATDKRTELRVQQHRPMPRFTEASRGGKNTRKSRGHADSSACFVRIEPIDVCAADTTRCYGRRQPPRLPRTTTPSPLAPPLHPPHSASFLLSSRCFEKQRQCYLRSSRCFYSYSQNVADVLELFHLTSLYTLRLQHVDCSHSFQPFPY